MVITTVNFMTWQRCQCVFLSPATLFFILLMMCAKVSLAQEISSISISIAGTSNTTETRFSNSEAFVLTRVSTSLDEIQNQHNRVSISVSDSLVNSKTLSLNLQGNAFNPDYQAVDGQLAIGGMRYSVNTDSVDEGTVDISIDPEDQEPGFTILTNRLPLTSTILGTNSVKLSVLENTNAASKTFTLPLYLKQIPVPVSDTDVNGIAISTIRVSDTNDGMIVASQVDVHASPFEIITSRMNTSDIDRDTYALDFSVSDAFGLSTHLNLNRFRKVHSIDNTPEEISFVFNDGTVQSYELTPEDDMPFVIYDATLNNNNPVPGVNILSSTVEDSVGKRLENLKQRFTVPNQTPVANAGADFTVSDGIVFLNAVSSTDPDGNIISYHWQQTGGQPSVVLTNPRSSIASFTVPEVMQDTVLTFMLTVTDNAGATDTDSVDVTIEYLNDLPVADAGDDITVTEGTVTLDGSASNDPNGSIVAYNWQQTGGIPVVSLSGANTSQASFTAPVVSQTTVLTFMLTVIDNDGDTASDEVNVTVNYVDQSPVVTPPENITIEVNNDTGLPVSDNRIASFLSDASATDDVDDGVEVTNNAPGVFPIGTTTVTFTAQDSAGNTGTAAATVTLTLVDVGAPVVTPPASLIIEVNDNNGLPTTNSRIAAFLASASATDDIDGVLSVSNNAPAIFLTGTTTVTFSATDSAGNTGTATSTVTLTLVDAGTPVVTPPASLTIEVNDNNGLPITDSRIAAFLASASATDDIDGTLNVTNNAPATFPTGTTTVTFSATDSAGNTGTATADLTLNLSDNVPPSADAGPDMTVIAGATVLLTGSGSDEDGEITAYNWEQISGQPVVTIIDGDTASASFTAPSVTETTPLVFRLTVTDDRGSVASDVVNVSINSSENTAPIANAGDDLVVAPSDTVSLDGSASNDTDGSIVSYFWQQTGGSPSVVLNSPGSEIASFTAPAVTASTTLTFSLVVTDDDDATSTDTIAVTVDPNVTGNNGNGGDLNLYVSLDRDSVTPNTWQHARVIIANNSGKSASDVHLSFTLPADTRLQTGYILPAADTDSCANSSRCNVGDIVRWSLGDIDNGDFTSVDMTLAILNTATVDSSIPLEFVVTYNNNRSSETTTESVEIVEEPGGFIDLTAAHRLVASDDEVAYEVSFANLATTGKTNTRIDVTLPSGSELLTSSSGAMMSGNNLSWDTGTLNSGDSGKHYFTLSVPENASDGDALEAFATLSEGGVSLSATNETVVVKNNVELTLDVTVTGDTVTPEQLTYFRYVVANKGGAVIDGVSLSVMPAGGTVFESAESNPRIDCDFSRCAKGDWGQVDIGSLSPGASRAIVVAARSNIPYDGLPWVTHARVSESSGNYTLSTTPTVLYSETDQLIMSMSANRNIVSSNEEVEYELSFGNLATDTAQNLTLVAQLPAGSHFLSASDGGMLNDGKVYWNIATLSGGTGSKRWFSVAMPTGLQDGEVLVNKAWIESNDISLVRAGESVVVRQNMPLTLDVTVTGDTITPFHYSYHRYVLANRGSTVLPDVTVNIMPGLGSKFIDTSTIPQTDNNAQCFGGDCESGNWYSWSMGDLQPGDSKVLLVPMEVYRPVDGTAWISHVQVVDGTGNFILGAKPTVIYDNTETLQLSMSAAQQVVRPGQQLEYEIAFGNPDEISFQDLVLEVELPEGMKVLSVSDSGGQSGRLVRWNLPELEPGTGGIRTLTALVPENLNDAEVLVSKTRLGNVSANLARAGESVVVREDTPLSLEATMVGSGFISSYYRYVVTNRGEDDLTDVKLELLTGFGSGINPARSVPEVTCPHSTVFGICRSGDFGFVELGQLSPGESRIVSIFVTREADFNPDGRPLINHALLTDGTGAYALGAKPTVQFNSELSFQQLALEADTFNLKPGELQTVKVIVGNIYNSENEVGEDIVSGILSVSIPDGYALESASGLNDLQDRSGRVAQVGSKVVWSMGDVPPGVWIEESVQLRANTISSTSETLRIKAHLEDVNKGSIAHASISAGVSNVDSTLLTVTPQFLQNTEDNASSIYQVTPTVVNDTGGQTVDTNLFFLPSLAVVGGQVFHQEDLNCNATGGICTPLVWNHWDFGNLNSTETVERNVIFGLNNSLPGFLSVSNYHLTYATTPVRDSAIIEVSAVGESTTISFNGDGDGDGLPDWWEAQYAATSRLNSSDTDTDTDADGLSNREEFDLFTSPDNADTDGDGLLDGEDDNPLIPDDNGGDNGGGDNGGGDNGGGDNGGGDNGGGDNGGDNGGGTGSSSFVAYDYDGDGKADVGVRRASNFHQYILNSEDGQIQRVVFGRDSGDISVSGDFDGDGIADVAVRRPSNFHWYIRNSSNEQIQRIVFGKNQIDIPVPADYDGDGITDVAVRRPSNQTWYIRNSTGVDTRTGHDDGISRVRFGLQSQDIPVPADYDGDGKVDIAVRRPSDQMWYILNSSDNQIQRIKFGLQSTDIPVPADYDGDGRADIAVRRPGNQTWYILNSSNGEIQRIRFGLQDTDIPIPADYDGDGKADVAVRRPSTYFQYILNSENGQIQRIQFGRSQGDVPLAAPINTRINMAQGRNGLLREAESEYPVIDIIDLKDFALEKGTESTHNF